LKPDSGSSGTVVRISGSGFGFSQDTGVVKFGANQANITSWKDTEIVAIAPTSAELQPVAVTVTTSSGVSNNDKSFTYTEGGEADKCGRTFFRPKNCSLLVKLRSSSYLNISSNEISDNQLLAYINKNTAAIELELLQIDYGYDLEEFFGGQNELEDERNFLKSLGKWQSFSTWTHRVLEGLRLLGDSTALQVYSNAFSVLGQVVQGLKVYNRALNVFTAFGTRAILRDYVDGRADGESAVAVWQDIDAVYGGELSRISARKHIPIDDLSVWFENAFVAFRLVGYSDSASLRFARGVAIARDALAD
jgi:hypothetical protein